MAKHKCPNCGVGSIHIDYDKDCSLRWTCELCDYFSYLDETKEKYTKAKDNGKNN